MKTQKDSKKQYTKVVLIISCVFAVISSVLLVIAICEFPQALKYPQAVKYLYKNGIEVDAHYKYYYDDYRLTNPDDPYKDYKASGLEAKSVPFNYDEEDYKFGYNKVELFTNYKSYATYSFKFDYTKSYFELNNLIIFNTTACSSDEMKFGEILENDGKLYPMFYRKKIANGQPVTDDFIVMVYCVEIAKDSEYKVGEVIYRYK